MRTGTRSSESEEQRDETKGKVGQVQVEARLTNSIDGLLRYAASIRRDFYRAIRTLREIQRERCEGSPDCGAGRGRHAQEVRSE